MARLYADEDFPFPVVERLRQLGHDILTALSAQFEVDEPTLRSDVVECLTDLLQRNLIILKS